MNPIKTHITPLEEKFITTLTKRLGSSNEAIELILYDSRAGVVSDEESDLKLGNS